MIGISDDLDYIHKEVELASHNKLNIAIVGFNYEQSRRAMNEIACADESTIVRKTDRIIEMSDGTRYHVFSFADNVRGYCIDQMITVDDFRWKVYKKQHEIRAMIAYRMVQSCVPEEFQFLQYEYPVIEEKVKDKYFEDRHKQWQELHINYRSREELNNIEKFKQEYEFKWIGGKE